MPDLVDTHAHLCDAAFRDDLPAVLERARAVGLHHPVLEVRGVIRAPIDAFGLGTELTDSLG